MYAETQNPSLPLDIQLVQQWASLAPSGSEIAIARRMSIVRVFSKYLHFIYPNSTIVPTKLIGRTHRRLWPFIYNQCAILVDVLQRVSQHPAKDVIELTLDH